MVQNHHRESTIIPAAILVLAGALVFTRYGWYGAFNAAVPMALALGWAVVLALACWGAGGILGRAVFAEPETNLEGTVLTLLAGTAVLMATAGVLAAFHLLYPPLLLATLAAWACLGALRLYRHPPDWGAGSRVFRQPYWIILLAAGGIGILAATTFAPFYDQWNYHLGFPFHWLRAGTIVTFDRHAYSFFPANMGLLYVYALAGPGAWAAQVAHWLMGALAAGGSAAVAGRLGAAVGGRVLAAALFLATPSAIQMSSLAAADLGVAAFGVGAILAVLRITEDPQQAIRWAAAGGGFAGFAAGCKYLALGSVAIPVGIVAAIVASKNGGKFSPRVRRCLSSAAVFLLALSLTVGPWLVRNAVATGNPVHP